MSSVYTISMISLTLSGIVSSTILSLISIVLEFSSVGSCTFSTGRISLISPPNSFYVGMYVNINTKGQARSIWLLRSIENKRHSPDDIT
jgi:hypothetical protein